MKTFRLISITIGCLLIGQAVYTTVEAQPSKENRSSSMVRIGVFDSRAVAAAWYRSEAHMRIVRGMKAEYRKAEAEGDTKRAAELEKEGSGSQEATHRQCFSNEPIDNVLKRIEKKLPEIAESAGVDILVSKWEIAYQNKSAEFVDVTWEMVNLFEPDEATVKMLRELIESEPVPADQLDHEH